MSPNKIKKEEQDTLEMLRANESVEEILNNFNAEIDEKVEPSFEDFSGATEGDR